MDLEKRLLLEHSKKNSLSIANYLLEKPEQFTRLLACLKSENVIIAQRAAMVLSALYDQRPEIVNKHVSELIELLFEEHKHVAISRNIIRVLQSCEIPENLQSAVFDYCLNEIQDPKSAIAVKAFSMQVLYNVCYQFPELSQELIPILENELARNQSKGVQARGKNILKKLYRLSDSL